MGIEKTVTVSDCYSGYSSVCHCNRSSLYSYVLLDKLSKINIPNHHNILTYHLRRPRIISCEEKHKAFKVESSHLVGLEPARREVIVRGLGRGAPLAREALAVRLEHSARKLQVPGRHVLLADCGVQVQRVVDRSEVGLLRSVSLLEEIPNHSHFARNAKITYSLTRRVTSSSILIHVLAVVSRDVVSRRVLQLIFHGPVEGEASTRAWAPWSRGRVEWSGRGAGAREQVCTVSTTSVTSALCLRIARNPN